MVQKVVSKETNTGVIEQNYQRAFCTVAVLGKDYQSGYFLER